MLITMLDSMGNEWRTLDGGHYWTLEGYRQRWMLTVLLFDGAQGLYHCEAFDRDAAHPVYRQRVIAADLRAALEEACRLADDSERRPL
jgi:hypothetical protein